MTFTFIDFLILLVIAGICGGLGEAITGSSRGGIFVAIALGFIGALFGMWLARQMNLPEPLAIQVGESGAVFPVVWSIAGSALFVVILNLFSAPFYRRP